MDIRRNIIQSVLQMLHGKVDAEVIDTVQDVLVIQLNQYEIQERSTELTVSDNSSEGLINKNPCTALSQIKSRKQIKKPYSAVEMELIRKSCTDKRDIALVEFLYSTGCRVSELVILKKSDIDFRTKEVYLFGKGSKHRISYINARAEIALKKYWLTRKDMDDSVICTVRQPYHGIKKPQIEQIIRQIGERANLGRNLYPHLIRHTTATSALERGMDVTELQKMLGHEKLDTTMIYAKVSQESLKYSHHRYVV